MSEDNKNWFQIRQERAARLKALAQAFQGRDTSLMRERLDELRSLLREIQADDTKPTRQERDARMEQWKQQHGDPAIEKTVRESMRDLREATREHRPTTLDLSMAIFSGDAADVRRLLEAGIDVNGAAAVGDSLLMKAALVKKQEVVQILLAAGATVGLLEAILLGEYDTVRALLDAGTDVNLSNRSGATALQWAAGQENVSIVELLLLRGADVNRADAHGHTALTRAAAKDHQEILSRLLAAGATVGLIEAAMLGDIDRMHSFLLQGADIESRNASGMTPLMAAAANGRVACVQSLLEKGADIYATARFGYTPLSYAVSSQRADVVNMLLDRGLDIDARNSDGNEAWQGQTLLHHAAFDRNGESMVRLLLERGAKIDLQTAAGYRPLHMAVTGRSLATIRLLLDAGADIDAGGSHNASALIMAARTLYSAEIVQLLLERGASVNAADEGGGRALNVAMMHGNTPVVEKLLDAGADVSYLERLHYGMMLDNADDTSKADILALLKAHGAEPPSPRSRFRIPGI
jgi:ankyrin repeat protein